MKRREAVNDAKRAVAFALTEGIKMDTAQICFDDPRVVQILVKISYEHEGQEITETIQLETTTYEVTE